jgi:hypothetical protein
MTGISEQHCAKDVFAFSAIAADQSGCGFLDARPMGIGEASALEGSLCIRMLPELGKHISVSEPCTLMQRHFLQDLADLAPRLLEPPVTTIGARQLDARVSEIGGPVENALERRDALGQAVLFQQRGTQKPQTVELTRLLRQQRTQTCLGARSPAGAQRRVRLAQALPEC